MHTGSTAVFGQSNLACDLFCWGPPLLYALVHSRPLSVSPKSWKYVYDIQIQSISRRFQFHQVSDEGGLCFLKEPGHSITNRRLTDVTPNVWVIPHMGKCLSSCALFSYYQTSGNHITRIYSRYIWQVWKVSKKNLKWTIQKTIRCFSFILLNEI